MPVKPPHSSAVSRRPQVHDLISAFYLVAALMQLGVAASVGFGDTKWERE